MEVLVGPAYGVEVSASPSPSCVRDRTTGVPPEPAQPHPQGKLASSSCLFLNNDDDDDDQGGEYSKTRDKCGSGYRSDDSSNSSSSIGAPGDSEDENESENEEVSSRKGEELQLTKFSMDLFEDALPIKRGLSNHYSGKSKSFGNLSEVNKVKDLEKEENPLNKRRRVLIATKLLSRKSFYSQHNPKSMPLLPILPDNDDDEEEEEEDDDNDNYHGQQHGPKY